MHINQCCIVIHWEQLPSWANVWWHRADAAVRPRGSQCNPGEMWPLLSCRERPWRPKESVSSQRLSRTDSCEAAAPACQRNSRTHTVRACDCERQPFPIRKGRRADAWISFSTFFFFFHIWARPRWAPSELGSRRMCREKRVCTGENDEGRLINAAQTLLVFQNRGIRCSFRLLQLICQRQNQAKLTIE